MWLPELLHKSPFHLLTQGFLISAIIFKTSGGGEENYFDAAIVSQKSSLIFDSSPRHS